MPLISAHLKDQWPIYIYGNNIIQNSKYFVGTHPRSSTPYDIQRTPIARGDGSTVVNQKPLEKQFELLCQIYSDNSKTNYKLNTQKILEDFKRIMSFPDRYFRVMPYGSYAIINNPKSISGWSVSDDGVNLGLDTDDFALDTASIKFDSTVSNSTNHSVTLSTTTNTAVNLSATLNSTNNSLFLPQWEIPISNPDETEIVSIDFKIGSSSSNYYEKTGITKNYENKNLEQLWNYLSIPHSSMTQVGTPNNAALGSYISIKFNYNSTAPNLTGFKFGGLLLTRDADVRNYRCYRVGDIEVESKPRRDVAVELTLKLLNYTGYAEGTQNETLFTANGVTSLSDTKIITLNGNRDLLPVLNLKLNSVTNLNQLKLSNINNNQFIFFANTWAANDSLVIDNLNKSVTRNGQAQDFTNGKLPSFNPGRNKVKLEVIQSNNTVLSYFAYDAESEYDSLGLSINRIAQSFVAPITGTLTQIKLVTRGGNLGKDSTNYAYIASNNSGNPSDYTGYLTSALAFNSSADGTSIVTNTIDLNLAVTSGTTYWIVLTGQTVSDGNGNIVEQGGPGCIWKRNSAGPYSSGSAKSQAGFTWSNVTGDFAFETTFAQAPSTNIDWNVQYKRLYN